MSDDATSRGPLANLVTEAKEGRLGLRIEPEDFVYIDRDCQRFMDLIQAMQRDARAISEIETGKWGLGESNSRLTSAQTLVGRFREKAKGSDNSVHAILEQHYQVVQDLQTLHREIRDRYMAADSAFAARVKDLLSRLPQQPTPIDPAKYVSGKGQPEAVAPLPGAQS
ncbi:MULTISPECIES: hypothetical protein [unclassified Nocardia]|uniref:hypothetical protein n=1 Tax=unclassified Nocardia TaxID=2637762 RepID=UPI001CE43E57|nr:MULTISPECIES: hypothetical protein [unclassified Nocardia]